ncbi:MAG TPA: hypothetical protein VGG04_04070 [Candidatus Sulfotelmatobacter sp.]|jgi:hypothetical protein
MKVVLLGLNHELQWKDPTGDLRQILGHLISTRGVDLVAEEAAGLPTTVAQRLAFILDKPWIDIDMNKAERVLAGIHESLLARRPFPIDPCSGDTSTRCSYLPREDGIREEEWLRRILTKRADVVLCVCGFMHLDPFAKRLEEKGCSVEQVRLTELVWFQKHYGSYSIVEDDGKRWCEIRYS